MLRHLLVLAAAASTCALAQAPLGLTASDGTGLALVDYRARAVIEGPLAFTELTLTFENPANRVLEGQFRVTLPRGATVSRFAMKLDGRWQEGEVVEKQAARRAYEDFLHRRQDPALLEQAAANEFSARVFPIPAHGKKELIVSYSHQLTSATEPWALPLRGLPKVKRLDVSVAAGGQVLASLSRTNVVPDKDFVAPQPPGQSVVRAGDLVLARVQAVATPRPQTPSSVLLLVDTSASRALGFGRQLKLVQGLVAGLARANASMPLTVVAFDQSVVQVYEGAAQGFGPAQVKALEQRRPLGASDVSRALAWAMEHGRTQRRERVVLVTDGVFTAGATEGDELLAAVARLKSVGVERLDAVGVGGIRDEAVLGRLARGPLPKAGVVLDGDQPLADLTRRLSEATEAKVAIDAPGATFVWPRALEGVQSGDEAVVVLQLASPGGAPKLRVGGRDVDLTKALSVARPLLERAWAQARIAALEDDIARVADGPKEKQRLRDEGVRLSTRYRVLSPWTALLVLETEADYARFDIDRKALADILTVDGTKVAVRVRKEEEPAPIPKRPPRPAPPAKDTVAKKKAEVSDDSGLVDAPGADGADDMDAARPPPAMGQPMAEPSLQEGAVAAAAPPPPASTVREARPAPRRSVSSGEAMEAPAEEERRAAAPRDRSGPQQGPVPWEGDFRVVMEALKKGDVRDAVTKAAGWREEHLDDVLALVALGEASEAAGDVERAARAYGSLIDLFPMRADMRRFAGERLDRLKQPGALELAADTYARAAEQRPDHPASHRLLAWALLRLGRYEKAFAAIERGLAQSYPSGRFAGVRQILAEDAGLIAAAWAKAQPAEAATITRRLKAAGGVVENAPSLRFVLTWETDANDVDFHIYDGKKNHAFYSQKTLPTGGTLYADVTTGYGPECFTIRAPKDKRAGPYTLQAHYYSRGPMGYGMGKLEVIEHDGKGGLTVEHRPFIVMVDQAFVDLGQVKP